MVDGCRSKLVDVVSGVPLGSVLGPLLFLLCTLEHFSILENNLIGDADDCFDGCFAIPRRLELQQQSYLGRVGEFCDLWGMKLYAS